jgi:hypothetical protein
MGETISNRSTVESILDFGSDLVTGTVNVFVTGLDAMGTFFELIPIWGKILTAVSVGIPQISALITLMILIVAVYIAMTYIKSVSNKDDLP